MTNTLVSCQLSNEFDAIQRRSSRFKSEVFGDRYDGITNTSLSKSVGLFEHVDAIASAVLAVQTVKQGLRTKRTSLLDMFKTGHTKKSLGSAIVDFLTVADSEDELKVKINTFVHTTLSTMFDAAYAVSETGSIHQSLPDDSLLVNVCASIGNEIEILSRLQSLRINDRDAFNKVFYSDLTDQVLPKDVHVGMAVKQLKTVQPSWVEWSQEQRVRVGRILVALVLNFFKDSPEQLPFELSIQRINSKTYVYLLPSERLNDKVESDFASIAQNLMVKEPMLSVPMPWSDGVHGGYLTNFCLHREDVVRGHQMLEGSSPSRTAYDFINRLQSISYKVNPFVLMVANLLDGQQVRVGKFFPHNAISAQKCKDGEKNWSVNPWTVRYARRTEGTLATARKFADQPEFWIPWSFDFRGRVYPIPSFMSPQGTDFDKSCLMFSKGESLTKDGVRWLKIHIATCAAFDGIDKKSLAQRVAWTEDNITQILAVANDPIGSLDYWSTAEEPWMFLAACREYLDAVVNGQPSHLMVATDATCSGIQVLSGLSLDRKAATLVNVVPSTERQDAYEVVASEAVRSLRADGRDDLADLITASPSLPRKVSKKVVMTVPYNASVQTNYGQVLDALKQAKVKATRDDANAIGKSLVKAMAVTVPGPVGLRDRFNKAVKARFNTSGVSPVLSWVTPSGFQVVQESFKVKTIKLSAYLEGRQELDVAVGYETDELGNPVVNAGGHKTSFMPNLIHSLDASLLHLTFHNAAYDFSVIHDSILTGPNHMGEAVMGLKQTYADMFKNGEYLKYLQTDVLECAEPLAEVQDTFDSSEVLDSEFFFS
jgi:DNA-directed RNA polymerase